MKQYEAYIHTNGKVQVKCMPFNQSTIDIISPFVKKYLGIYLANSFEEAEEFFNNKAIDLIH